MENKNCLFSEEFLNKLIEQNDLDVIFEMSQMPSLIEYLKRNPFKVQSIKGVAFDKFVFSLSFFLKAFRCQNDVSEGISIETFIEMEKGFAPEGKFIPAAADFLGTFEPHLWSIFKSFGFLCIKEKQWKKAQLEAIVAIHGIVLIALCSHHYSVQRLNSLTEYLQSQLFVESLSKKEKETLFNLVAPSKISTVFSNDSSEMTNSLGMTFRLIPAGTFIMGSPENEPYRDEDEFQHRVTLTKGFYMQTTQVTQGQWEAVMGNNPSEFSNCGDNCPVENVSWKDTQKFIARLNKNENGRHYRLPTEAEWEYACRAGTTTPFNTGSCLSKDEANYEEGYRHETIAVGSFDPNAWGLYDMHGNVMEWCQDSCDYDCDYYIVTDTYVDGITNPLCSKGSLRVARGGCWDNGARGCRSAYRVRVDPAYRNYYLGLRLVFSAGHQ